jgi:hypothetical protein
MNSAPIPVEQASYILLGRYLQRQQSHADKSGDRAGNITSSFHHIILSAEISLGVVQYSLFFTISIQFIQSQI